jgi:hypothetical protein
LSVGVKCVTLRSLKNGLAVSYHPALYSRSCFL